MSALALVVPLAAPAVAQAPDRVEEPIFLLTLDVKHDKAVFWNITRDHFCEWVEGGFEGPPPVQSLVDAQIKETGQGALVARFDATSDLELWDLDDPANPQDPCSDTDGQPGPWAQGVAKVSVNDNDLDVSGTRRNSFGDTGTGKVTDATGGAWHYSWTFRAHCSVDCEFDFSVKAENFTLRRLGR